MGNSLGLSFAVARQLWMAGFYLGFLTVLNNVPQVTKMTTAGVWNYTVFWLSFITLAVEVLIVISINHYITLFPICSRQLTKISTSNLRKNCKY